MILFCNRIKIPLLHLMYLKMCSKSPSQHFVVVQALSCVQLFATPWTVTCKASLSFTNSQSLVNSYLSSWWWYSNISSSVSPFSPCPQSFPSSESFLMSQLFEVAKVLNLQFQTNSSNEYSGLIYFRIDWFDLLAVQGTFKSLLQHHTLKASILCCSAFFMVPFSHPYYSFDYTDLCRQSDVSVF